MRTKIKKGRKYRAAVVLGAVLALAAAALFYHFHPAFPFPLSCAVYEFTGFYCPGCGGTRAAICLLRGRVWTAFKYNPGVVILAAVTGLGLIEKIFNKKILPRALVFWVVLIIVLFSYYILRNFTSSLSAL